MQDKNGHTPFVEPEQLAVNDQRFCYAMADEKGESWNALSVGTLRKYTNKRSYIYLKNNSRKLGWVHSIDPVTRTVVLEEQDEASTDDKELTFVLGHAISRVVLESDANSSQGPRHGITDFIGDNKSNDYSEDELAKRRAELIEWLTLNRVAVTECSSEDSAAVLSVMGVLYVEPPYDPECCRCSNEIILDRVQKLIKAKQDHAM